MPGNSKLIAFAATANPARALTFYHETLGLKPLGLRLRADTPFAIVFDANGTTLRVQKVESVAPPMYTVLGWEVADITTTVQDLTRRGVVFERFDNLQQDEQGIWTTPDGARIAWFKDPDRNTLSLTQSA